MWERLTIDEGGLIIDVGKTNHRCGGPTNNVGEGLTIDEGGLIGDVRKD